MTSSPVRMHGKAQHPKNPYDEVHHRFEPFCRDPVEKSYSPRRFPAASMQQSGSSIEHPSLRVFSQFGPGSEDYRKKALVIHRKPRYEPISHRLEDYQREQASLLQQQRMTETLPRPPTSQYALPHPTASLTTPNLGGAGWDAQSIIRHRKREAAAGGASTSSSYCSGTLRSADFNATNQTLSGYSIVPISPRTAAAGVGDDFLTNTNESPTVVGSGGGEMIEQQQPQEKDGSTEVEKDEVPPLSSDDADAVPPPPPQPLSSSSLLLQQQQTMMTPATTTNHLHSPSHSNTTNYYAVAAAAASPCYPLLPPLFGNGGGGTRSPRSQQMSAASSAAVRRTQSGGGTSPRHHLVVLGIERAPASTPRLIASPKE